MSHVTWTSSLVPLTIQGTLQKTYFTDDGPNEVGQTTAVSVHNCSILLNVVGKLS